MKYLTEDNLGDQLKIIFPNLIFTRNKKIPHSSINNRPDYVNHELMLIVEYDGPRHYTESACILRDELKDATYTKMGYNVIRFPYFIEISSEIIKYRFNINLPNFKWDYPAGFIDPHVILPADFCELGIQRFLQDLETFKYLYDDIITSLIYKVSILGDSRLVIPPSINYLLKK